MYVCVHMNVCVVCAASITQQFVAFFIKSRNYINVLIEFMCCSLWKKAKTLTSTKQIPFKWVVAG